MDTIDKVRIIESDAAPKEDVAVEEVMATIFHTDGSREKVAPANGSEFRLEEMQKMVGGIIEIVYFDDNTVMVINEEGKLLGLPPEHGRDRNISRPLSGFGRLHCRRCAGM